jgi:DDE domain
MRAFGYGARSSARASPANCAGDDPDREARGIWMRIASVLHYLWRAVNLDGVVLDILIQSRRDAGAAKRFFKRLLSR